ncbi:MAG TPA: hypothetical protein VK604_17545 [Bryobacteraceae bacterium]|nr:hypothetical protein [Bryobacteraceae bacterium]
MRRLIRVVLASALAALPLCATTFQVKNADEKAWGKILGSVGIRLAASGTEGDIVVAGPGEQADSKALSEKHLVILEGFSPAAQSLGIVEKTETVAVRQICDTHAPKMQIIWEQAANVKAVEMPAGFQVFARERWKGAPVLAGKRMGPRGGVLWMATAPGVSGIERYPYLLHALVDLGLDLPAKTMNLWAFFDSSYRIRADSEYLAKRWRQAGIGELHVAAWHNMEPDQVQDEYLKKLIEACHRNAILVYAWLELPHVSEKFWADHPAWREKTAIGQDAQLDWRKLMNLQNGECRAAVQKEIGGLLRRFDWDGVNLAELYFESLEGASNPARFTPMNDDVRQDFKRVGGFDPKLLFEAGSEYALAKRPEGLRKFLDYRAELDSRMQKEWLEVIDKTRTEKPYLDIVLTHIDDRFEPGIRDALGADVARSLPMIQARKSMLLVEDPATLWHLGPERYSKLAEKYRELTPDRKQIAVDINVVERYQDVYPTKKQTGVELLELVHEAAVSFARVALYFENSLEKQDLALLPAAAAAATVQEIHAGAFLVNAQEPTRVKWQGAARMDGKLWPVTSGKDLLAPAGEHRFEASAEQPAVAIADFNGDVHSAVAEADRSDLSYTSRGRAVAVLGSAVSSIEVDGTPFWKGKAGESTSSFVLPAGQHLVTFYR